MLRWQALVFLLMLAALLPARGASAEDGQQPAAARDRHLTLQEALTTALQRSPAIRAAQHTATAAREREGAVFSAYLPVLSADLGYNRLTGNFVPRPGLPPASLKGPFTEPDGVSFDYYSLGLTLRQPLYDFGRTGGAEDSARAGLAAAEQDLAVRRLDAGYQVVVRYFAVLAAQEMVGVAARTEEQARRYAERAVAWFEGGSRPRLDVVRAEADARSAAAALSSARRGLVVARSALLDAMGASTTFDFIPEPAPLPAPDAAPRPLAEAIPEALASRPELASLRARREAQQGVVRVQRSGYFPAVAAVGTLTDAGMEQTNLVWNWTAGLSLSMPLFNGFATGHQVGEAEEVGASLQAALEGEEISVRAQVEQATAQVEDARARLGPLQAAEAAAREALALAEDRYEAGSANQIELLDARNALANAEAAAVRANFDLATSWASYHRALGRPATSWVADLPAPGKADR